MQYIIYLFTYTQNYVTSRWRRLTTAVLAVSYVAIATLTTEAWVCVDTPGIVVAVVLLHDTLIDIYIKHQTIPQR